MQLNQESRYCKLSSALLDLKRIKESKQNKPQGRIVLNECFLGLVKLGKLMGTLHRRGEDIPQYLLDSFDRLVRYFSQAQRLSYVVDSGIQENVNEMESLKVYLLDVETLIGRLRLYT